jgi:ribosome modulation factor
MMIASAYKAGFRAGRLGLSYSRFTYSRSEDWLEWYEGWKKGHEAWMTLPGMNRP